MPHEYFSEREIGKSPRVVEEIPLITWKGIHAVINKWYNGNAFYGMGLGQNEQFINLLSAEIPTLFWPLSAESKPLLPVILDLIEFCHKNILCPTNDYRDLQLYEEYRYLSVREIGQESFRGEINKIFERNGIIFELSGNGSITRLAPDGLRELLQQTKFHTGDPDLDELLNAARNKILNSDPDVRKDSLEKLWDAWERLKTIEPGDKKISITTLLKKTSPEPNFYNRIDTEASELTEIGNQFRIRHHEIGKIPITSSDQVDYLFHRMFSLIYLILKSTNRII